MDTVAMKQAMINALEYRIEELLKLVQSLESNIQHKMEIKICEQCATTKYTGSVDEQSRLS